MFNSFVNVNLRNYSFLLFCIALVFSLLRFLFSVTAKSVSIDHLSVLVSFNRNISKTYQSPISVWDSYIANLVSNLQMIFFFQKKKI